MVSINSTTINQSQITTALKSASDQKTTSSLTVENNQIAQKSDAQISSQAQSLSDLYDTASSYVKSQHMESFSGYVEGKFTPAAYINVGKYNSQIFEKAATNMVDTAQKQGISLDKKNVLEQLRQDNPEITKIVSDDAKTSAALGSSSILLNLSSDDKNSLTDIYINAKDNGLDLGQVDVLATSKAFNVSMGSNAGQGTIMPYDWDWSETDPEKIAAAKESMLPSSTVIEKAEEVKSKLMSDLGLGDDFIKSMLNTENGQGLASSATLDFLSRYADIPTKKNDY